MLYKKAYNSERYTINKKRISAPIPEPIKR